VISWTAILVAVAAIAAAAIFLYTLIRLSYRAGKSAADAEFAARYARNEADASKRTSDVLVQPVTDDDLSDRLRGGEF
jgi:peptidoglycan/LPS O-acetylase OafA/YrhL